MGFKCWVNKVISSEVEFKVGLGLISHTGIHILEVEALWSITYGREHIFIGVCGVHIKLAESLLFMW